MIGWGLVACGLAIMVSAALFVRYAKLPPWTHRDLLAFLALLATIGGAMILTILKYLQTERFNQQSDRLIAELVRERPSQISSSVGKVLETIIDSVTWNTKLDSVGIIVVLLSLGLVISARTLKGKIFGNEFEMQTGEAQRAAAEGARQTAAAADAKADQIAESAGGGAERMVEKPDEELPDYAK